MQESSDIVVCGLDAQLLSLGQQNLLLHKLRTHPLLKQAEQPRIVGVVLPLHLLPGKIVHLLLAHCHSRRKETAVPVGVNHGISIGGCNTLAGKAWDEVNHHGHRDHANDDDENRLDDAAIFLLEETNHEWI